MFVPSNLWKPGVGTQIDWGNPLSQNLAHCWLFNESAGSTSQNLGTGGTANNCTNIGVSGNSLTWTTTPFGVGVLQNTGTPCSAGILPTLHGAARATLMVFGQWDASSQYMEVGGADFTTGNRFGFSLAAGSVYAVIDNGSTIGNNSATRVAGTSIAMAFDGTLAGAKVSIWQNGVPSSVTPNNQPTSVFALNMPWHFGYATLSNSKISAVYLWIGRALTSTDINQLVVNPWCFLEDQNQLYLVTSSIPSGPIDLNVSAVSSNSVSGGETGGIDAPASSVVSDSVVGEETFDLSAVLYVGSASTSAFLGGANWPIAFTASGLMANGVTGGQTFSGSYTFYTTNFDFPLNPNHWANQSLSSWWMAPSGQGGGVVLPDLAGKNNMTAVNYAGSDSRPGGPWSPGFRSNALSNVIPGPFTWSSTSYYFQSNTSINTLCPAAGTISLWHCAQSTADGVLLNQGNTDSGSNFVFWRTQGWLTVGFGSHVTSINTTALGIWRSNVWFNIIATFAAGDLVRVYCNGVFVGASDTLPTPLPTVSTPLLSLGSGFNGTPTHFALSLIDDVNIWPYQMTTQQVAQVYNESLAGWPNRIANWDVQNRFSPGPYWTGIGINLNSPIVAVGFGGTKLNTDIFASTPGSDVWYGSTDSTVLARTVSCVTNCYTGPFNHEFDALFSSVVSLSDVGIIIPPGAVYLFTPSVESTIDLGGCVQELGIQSSASGADANLANIAGIWNTTFVEASASGASAVLGSNASTLTISLVARQSLGSTGAISVYAGAWIFFGAVTTSVAAGSSVFEVDVVRGMEAPQTTATQGGRKSGLNPWLSALEADAVSGAFSKLITSNVHGVASTVRTGNAPFGPWVELVATTAAAALGDIDESIVILTPSRKADVGVGAARSTTAVRLVSVETGTSQGSTTWDFIRRLTALHADSLLGSGPSGPVVGMDAVGGTGTTASQDNTVTARVRSPQSVSSSARIRSTATTETSAASGNASASNVFNAAPSPAIHSVQVSSIPGTKKANVSVSGSAQSSDAVTSGLTPAVSPALHGLTTAVGLGTSRRTVLVDMDGLEGSADAGGNTELVVIRCIGFQTIATPGSKVFYSDPVNLGAPGVSGIATLGSRRSIAAMVSKTPYSMGSTGASRSAWSTLLGGVTATATIGSFTSGPVMRVWAVDSGVAVGLGLPSSPPVDLDILALSASIGVGETLAVVAAIIGAPVAMTVAGGAGNTLYISMVGIQAVGTFGSSPPSIEPYAYPDPFQSTDTEEVDPFDAQSGPRH